MGNVNKKDPQTTTIIKAILKKLNKNHCYKAKHYTQQTILHSIERQHQGKAKQILKQLVAQGYIVKSPHSHGDSYYLSPRAMALLRQAK